MIITGTHWMVATLIAVAVHLAGALWLTIASPTQQPRVDDAGDGIVVTLGRAARDAVESPRAPEPEQDAAVTATAEARPEELEPEEPASAALTEPEPDAAVTADASPTDSVSPDTVEPRQLPDAVAVEPEPARDEESPPVDTVEPEAAPVRQAAEIDASEAPGADSETLAESPAPAAETVVAEEILSRPELSLEPVEAASSPPEPTVEPAEAVVSRPERSVEPAQAAPSRPEQAEESVEAGDLPVVMTTDTATEPGDAVPRELTGAAPAPELPEAGPREVPSADAGPAPAAPRPAESGLSAAPAAADPAPIEDVADAPAGQNAPRTAIQTVAPDVGAEPDLDVAIAREPAPAAEQATDVEVTEPTAPETVRLQDLEERAGGSGVTAHYAGVLKGWLQRNMHYPRAARLAGQEGDVVVRFVIDRDGNVQSVELESGSGYPLLDREATEMVERGDPFPAIPGDMPGERLEVRVPVSFHVRDETRTRDLPPIDLK